MRIRPRILGEQTKTYQTDILSTTRQDLNHRDKHARAARGALGLRQTMSRSGAPLADVEKSARQFPRNSHMYRRQSVSVLHQVWPSPSVGHHPPLAPSLA